MKPTFVRRQTESYIDITCKTSNIQKGISYWQILEEETLTEHQYIYSSISTGGKNQDMSRNIPLCDWALFKELPTWRITAGVETTIELERVMKDVYRRSTTTTRKARIPFWWNEEIQEKRKICLRLRRGITRTRKRMQANEEVINQHADLKRSKKELQHLINASKRKHWDDLSRELGEDIWGIGYKIATIKLMGYAAFDIAVEKKVEIAKELFLTKIRPGGNLEPRNVLTKMKSGKAPGVDGIPTEAIKILEQISPAIICRFHLRLFGHLQIKS
ncbi:hypothetical protein JTB14_030089 [Gonioctena quinquepunctata]|nr:hypothetical protein JTB14_030089 [Gonioctena quinquepunctata]